MLHSISLVLHEMTENDELSERHGSSVVQGASADLRIMRLPEVMNVVGLRRAAIYEAIRAGSFPKPVKLTGRSVGWIDVEIKAWVAERIRERATEHETGFINHNNSAIGAPQENQLGYLISAKDYREFQRLKRFERRVRSLPPAVRQSVNACMFSPGGEEIGSSGDD